MMMETLASRSPGSKLYLLVLPPTLKREPLLALSAQLARRGGLRVVDCGNRFNAHQVASMLRSYGCYNLTETLDRIHVARALQNDGVFKAKYKTGLAY